MLIDGILMASFPNRCAGDTGDGGSASDNGNVPLNSGMILLERDVRKVSLKHERWRIVKFQTT